MTSIKFFLASLLFVVLVAAGCSQSNSPSRVSGKITYKGQPVPSGTVSFYRTGEEQSGAYSFPLKSDGTYEGAGLLPEEMLVTVETESANTKRPTPKYGAPGGKGNNPMAEYDKMMQEKGFKPAAPTDAGQYVPIPKKYAEKKSSPLRAPLKRGKNVLNFDLMD
jgi:hypothetical protein